LLMIIRFANEHTMVQIDYEFRARFAVIAVHTVPCDCEYYVEIRGRTVIAYATLEPSN
jgi:hypothetical protein